METSRTAGPRPEPGSKRNILHPMKKSGVQKERMRNETSNYVGKSTINKHCKIMVCGNFKHKKELKHLTKIR